MSERRHDPLTGVSVILATQRSARPQAPDPADSSPRDCPFCPGHEHETPPPVLELSRGAEPGWFVRVFPNRYPIVTPEKPASAEGRSRAASGVHEVVVETPRHDQEMAQRTPEELALTLRAYRERLVSLHTRSDIRHVAVFKNKGAAGGNSLAHPHSQIVGLSYVPRAVQLTASTWRRHHRRNGACLLCLELARERDDGRRIVREQDGFVLYAPFASSRPAELTLAPLAHEPDFQASTGDSLAAISRVLHPALQGLVTAFGDPAYNLVLQTWPRSPGDRAALHWYLRILPRLGVLGGFELTTGDYVSTLAPEDAAAAYREAGRR